MFEKIQTDYFSFQGRLNRKPYIITTCVISLVSSILSGVFYRLFPEVIFLLLSFILFTIMTIISFSITFRRLHDLGSSKLAYLWFFVPIANIYWTYKILCVRGTYGDNEYGPDPLLNLEKY